MKLSSLLAMVAVLSLTGSAFAQKTATPVTKPAATAPAKKPAAKTNPVYVCSTCKMGYSHNAAKAMKMKCPMGHELAKMDKLPDGFKAQNLGDVKKSGAVKTAPKPAAKPAPKK